MHDYLKCQFQFTATMIPRIFIDFADLITFLNVAIPWGLFISLFVVYFIYILYVKEHKGIITFIKSELTILIVLNILLHASI